MLALTHLPSPHLARCQLTHIDRVPIDLARAAEQHEAYGRLLQECGAEVRRLDVNLAEPDGVFIEDTAVVLDEVAVLASMGTAARRPEVDGIEPVLRAFRPLRRIEPPATLEGGDVLRVGRTLFVGLSARTNAAGARALEVIVAPLGYRVVPVPVRGCLHLKTACTAIDDHRLLINPAWLDTGPLAGFERLAVAEEEPWAANVVLLGGRVIMAAGQERTAERVRRLGHDVRGIDLSEFAKAEGGVTCLSLLIAQR